jgi:hypothetical protein
MKSWKSLPRPMRGWSRDDKGMSEGPKEQVRAFLIRIHELLDYIDDLERKLNYARLHIKRHLDAFPVDERMCMVGDGILGPEEADAGPTLEAPGRDLMSQIKGSDLDY